MGDRPGSLGNEGYLFFFFFYMVQVRDKNQRQTLICFFFFFVQVNSVMTSINATGKRVAHDIRDGGVCLDRRLSLVAHLFACLLLSRK